MIKRLSTCCLLLMAIGQTIWADCRLSLVPVSMNAGGKGELIVNLTNTEEVTAFQFDLRLPTGVNIATTVNDDEETVLDVSLTDRKKSSHRVTCSQQSDGRFTVAVLSGQNQSLKNSEGAVVKIKITAVSTLTSGSYTAQLENIHIVPLVDGKPGTRIDQENVEGTINIANASQSDDVVVKLSIATTQLAAADNQKIEVALENNIEITSMQFDIKLPEGFVLNTVLNEDEEQVLDAQLSTRKHSSHTINCASQEDGSYRVVVISGKNKALTGTSGTIVTFGVNVPLTLNGSVNLDLTNIHLVPLVNGAPGVRIDQSDITQSISINNQGGGNEPTGPVAMTVASLSMQPGETSTLYIDMTNDRNITSFQFKILLPEGISVVKEYNDDDEYVEAISLVSSRKKSSHDLSFKKTDDGGYFLLAYSATNATFKGNSGHLVSIKVKADESMSEGTYGVVLSGVVMNTPDEEKITQEPYSASITIGNGSGINAVTGETIANSTWFNMKGQSVNANSKGIVIRRDVMSDGSIRSTKIINK